MAPELELVPEAAEAGLRVRRLALLTQDPPPKAANCSSVKMNE